MPRLPSSLSLGGRPQPQDSGMVPRYQAGQVEQADMQAGEAVAKTGQELAQVGDKMMLAQQRIGARQDAVSRARDYGAFSEAAEGEFRRVSTEDDLADLGTVEKYGNYLNQTKQKILDSHKGSADSRGALEARLEEMRTQFASRVAAQSQTAQDKVVLDMVGGRLNSIAMKSWDPNSSLVDSFRQWDKEVDDMAPALRPGQEADFRRTGRERIAESKIGALISRGAIDAAEDLLATPGLPSVLGQQAQTRIQTQILAARQEIAKAESAGFAKRAEFKALFGRDPQNDQEMMQFLGRAGQAPDNQMEEVGDATSPTGTRLVPRALASQPGRLTPEVLATYAPGKPSGGLNAQFGPDGRLLSLTTGRAGGQQSAVPGMGTEGANQVDKELLSALAMRQSLQAVNTKFKPEYQQFATKAGVEWSALKEKLGSEIPPDDKRLLDDFTDYRAEVGQVFADKMKAMGGSAITPSEAARQEVYLPKTGTGIFDGDSPTELATKIRRMTEFTDKAIARLAYTKSKGVKFDSVNLDEMPKIMQKRGDELEKMLSDGGLNGEDLKAAVRTQIVREFGLLGQ